MALRRSLVLLAFSVLAGCQDYKFNPVGKCILQPGATRVTLSNLSSADILFVVDDSGSMQAEQTNLADNFGAFIDALAQAQQERALNGLEPFEFHIAVTTSAVFEGWTFSNPGTCGGSPLQCVVPDHYTGATTSLLCSDQGVTCNDLVRNYQPVALCTNLGRSYGVGKDGAPYPSGDFVADGSNPRVLHFTKTLNWKGGAADPTIAPLVQQFKQNINVGTCGSGMEQLLEGGRLAVQKALKMNGLSQPASVGATEWPHTGAKMVVVWAGDEDDCSNPNDPTRALAFPFTNEGNPGDDVCTTDRDRAGGPLKLFSTDSYVDFFAGLGRPFSAAFIYSTTQNGCTTDPITKVISCEPGTCACETPCPAFCNGVCGEGARPGCDCLGKAAGKRLKAVSTGLRGKGYATLEASVCAADWSNTLKKIAELVVPPPDLQLPTKPAATQVTALRVESADGSSSRLCNGPAADDAATTSPTGADWWFTDCKGGWQAEPSTCIHIRHPAIARNPGTNHCGEAAAGETYVAQYLGVVPPKDPTSTTNPLGGCLTADDCVASLGGAAASWQCTASGTTRGTCLCARN